MVEPIVLQYRLETLAGRARVWRALSDTDAFNRAAKAGFSYTDELDENGRRRQIGTVTKLGLKIRFREEPFSFRAPEWFRIRRHFEGGPASKLTATARLTAREGGGTVVDYTLELAPRSALLRPLLALDLRGTTKPTVGAALESVIRALDDGVEDDPERGLAGPTPSLSSAGAAKLAALSRCLPESPLVKRLVSFIRGAAEREQSLIAPVALAQAWMASLDEVVTMLVDAARVGLLGVRLDLLCPVCLVPRAPANFEPGQPRIHCEGCGISLDESFPEGLAVHFFTSPEIRTLRTKIECLGSPGRTPHVVAQETVAQGETADLTVSLTAGMYQLRTLPAVGPAALLEVTESEQAGNVAFSVRTALQPQMASVRPEPRALTFRNDSASSVTVLLERLVPARRVLTLGRLLVEFPALRDIVPGGGFFSNMVCFHAASIAMRTATAGEAIRMSELLKHARLVYPSDATVLALYPEVGSALDDLCSLDLRGVLTGLALGTAFEHTLGGRVVPMGPSVDYAYAMLARSGPGRIAVPRAQLDDAELDQAARDRGLATGPSPTSSQDDPAAWLWRNA